MTWHSRKELQRRYQLEKQTTSTYIATVFIGMYEYDYRVSRYKSQEWYGNRAVNEVILFCVHMETHQYHCELSLKFPTPIWSKAISISLLSLDILVKFNVKLRMLVHHQHVIVLSHHSPLGLIIWVLLELLAQYFCSHLSVSQITCITLSLAAYRCPSNGRITRRHGTPCPFKAS